MTVKVIHAGKQYHRLLMQLSFSLLCPFSVDAKRQCEKCHYCSSPCFAILSLSGQKQVRCHLTYNHVMA